MSRHLIAAARTPWVRRGGPLAAVHPEALLRVAIVAALERANLAVTEVAMVLVACDTPVGAQGANIARRVTTQIGAPDVAAITLDGDRVGACAALQFALALDGPVVVAAVDMPSVVPPGAALVRDYGRPTTRGSTENDWLANLADAAQLSRRDLDDAAEAVGTRPPLVATSADGTVAAVAGAGRSMITADLGPKPVNPATLELLVPTSAALTAAHIATLADGAAAVVIDDGPARTSTRALISATVRAAAPDAVMELLRGLTKPTEASTIVLCDSSLVVPVALGHRADHDIASPLQLGSAPSADVLRMLVDALAALAGPFRLVGRGRSGQVGVIEVGSAGRGL